ncbi:hypothetical protein BDN71DRAFT_690897 [Pleurotus eryngii]|uniref:Uncharacterized protein n=1 Tax=Pleurotus eryngii TaxID=5323 RepID=A0A9P5ZIU3_PLEER|nr:hypothetical protein BDN71DRAFT_690897 [Pleurotus eryngii]
MGKHHGDSTSRPPNIERSTSSNWIKRRAAIMTRDGTTQFAGLTTLEHGRYIQHAEAARLRTYVIFVANCGQNQRSRALPGQVRKNTSKNASARSKAGPTTRGRKANTRRVRGTVGERKKGSSGDGGKDGETRAAELKTARTPLGQCDAKIVIYGYHPTLIAMRAQWSARDIEYETLVKCERLYFQGHPKFRVSGFGDSDKF